MQQLFHCIPSPATGGRTSPGQAPQPPERPEEHRRNSPGTPAGTYRKQLRKKPSPATIKKPEPMPNERDRTRENDATNASKRGSGKDGYSRKAGKGSEHRGTPERKRRVPFRHAAIRNHRSRSPGSEPPHDHTLTGLINCNMYSSSHPVVERTHSTFRPTVVKPLLLNRFRLRRLLESTLK